jgi:hypothetical protein
VTRKPLGPHDPATVTWGCPHCNGRITSKHMAWMQPVYVQETPADILAEHAAEVARLSKRSDAVARLVEACRKVVCEVDDLSQRSWDYTEQDAANDLREALAAVEKEMQP